MHALNNLQKALVSFSTFNSPSNIGKGLHARVLAFGNGSQGALGLGTDTNEYEPEMVMEGSLAAVGAGHYHSFCIDADGHLWSWGRNQESQLGRPTNAEELMSPGRVKGMEGVKVKYATGSGVASFACTSEGDLLSWGISKRGQLGLGSQQASTPNPTRVPGLQDIVAVAAGWGHALALNDDGEVYSWGFPQHGRLGHTFADSPLQDEEQKVLQRCVWEPQRIQGLDGIKIDQIATGMDFSLAVEIGSGRLFSLAMTH